MLLLKIYQNHVILYFKIQIINFFNQINLKIVSFRFRTQVNDFQIQMLTIPGFFILKPSLWNAVFLYSANKST